MVMVGRWNADVGIFFSCREWMCQVIALPFLTIEAIASSTHRFVMPSWFFHRAFSYFPPQMVKGFRSCLLGLRWRHILGGIERATGPLKRATVGTIAAFCRRLSVRRLGDVPVSLFVGSLARLCDAPAQEDASIVSFFCWLCGNVMFSFHVFYKCARLFCFFLFYVQGGRPCAAQLLERWRRRYGTLQGTGDSWRSCVTTCCRF